MIELSPPQRQRLVASIQRYADEHLEMPMGELKAGLLLDFVLEEIGPTVHNRALEHARAFLTDRLADMENSCAEPEFTFWTHSPG